MPAVLVGFGQNRAARDVFSIIIRVGDLLQMTPDDRLRLVRLGPDDRVKTFAPRADIGITAKKFTVPGAEA